ncbi:DnaJ domain-containing protein [Lipomyces japonicus]|uniref:DnaJ domain-containing protein n=1 Tax=Lipomyces japonicus TaxID=56871 RepID=UPI0034CD43B1
MKTCYYEILEISRQASDDDIKRAYRRQALRLHPDKNMNNVAEATEKFALVQAAYEILSDPDERAWYDSHRDQILRDEVRGGGSKNSSSVNAEGTSAADILRYFDPGLFSIYDDSEIGFFTIAGQVFVQLSSEETFDDQVDRDATLPRFGTSGSSWQDQVRFFYAAWTGFSSRKTFVWADLYRMSDAPDRRVRRAMEKENKKARDAARKEYNDAVRALVLFLRKRDPRGPSVRRTTANNASAATGNDGNAEEESVRARREEDVARAKAQAARARAAHREKFDDYQEQEWLRPVEQNDGFWDEEYGGRRRTDRKDESKQPTADDDGDDETFPGSDENNNNVHDENDDADDDYDSDEVVVYECVACNKTFKSENQLDAHEKSKKHIKTVKEMIRRMRKENKKLGLDIDEQDGLDKDMAGLDIG